MGAFGWGCLSCGVRSTPQKIDIIRFDTAQKNNNREGPIWVCAKHQLYLWRSVVALVPLLRPHTKRRVCVCMCPILGNAADCGLLILSRGCDGALDERKKGHKLALGIVSSSSLYTSPSPSPPLDGSFFLPKNEPNLTVPDWNTDDEVRTRFFRLDPETVSLLHSRVYV